jgi:hypothetical protein
MKYTIDYFIKKFKRIPQKNWITGDLNRNGKCCVLGHLGINDNSSLSDDSLCENKKVYSLYKIFKKHPRILNNPSTDIFYIITSINDAKDMANTGKNTPKDRVLDVLYFVKHNCKNKRNKKK